MKMTPEGAKQWVTNPETPNRIIAEVLDRHALADYPLPDYLRDHLNTLAEIAEPTQGQVDEARIPLVNWFRQRREEATDGV